MKISSNFTDYYDMMQQYGKDDNLVFMRVNKHGINFDSNQWKLGGLENELTNENLMNQLKNASFKSFFGSQKVMNDLMWKLNDQQSDRTNPKYKLKEIIAVVNGIPFNSYLLLEWISSEKKNMENLNEYMKHNSYKIKVRNISEEESFNFLKEHIDELSSSYIIKEVKKIKSFEEYKNIIENKKYFSIRSTVNKQVTKETLLKIHEEVKSPIYFIVNNKVVTNIPLRYLGMTDLFNNNVEQLYQEMSYCLGNVILNKNEPPEQISNEMKIQQYGFDNKISFRKRT